MIRTRQQESLCDLATYVSFLLFQPATLHGVLPQAFKRRNHVLNDQGKVWRLLRSKTKTAQINEALCKVLAHNICCLIQSMFELEIKPEFWQEAQPWMASLRGLRRQSRQCRPVKRAAGFSVSPLLLFRAVDW
ncbi:MAG: hypothetical protein AUJ04_02540 [Acidobacteria bacterium 13_1_40CM_3_55_6]|nr:MAG: hypothetical protein AUJ04_02540 [Acidobacteria bacterium 13_1_40CM_3_55_6]